MLVHCHGPNYADANADFTVACRYRRRNKFNVQLRVSETVRIKNRQIIAHVKIKSPKQDYKSYALLTFCSGPVINGQYQESMGILGPKKSGVHPAVRRRLVKRLVKAGWNPEWIRRVPSQNDC